MYYGLQCTGLATTLTRRHVYLRETVILLKKLLHSRGLNQSYQGGMSSFTLTLMVSAFLSVSPEFPSAAHCFLAVLQYFGKIFDPLNMAVVQDCIVLAPGCSTCEGAPLVADPFRPELNAARNVVRFGEVAALMREVHDRLMCLYEEWDHEAPILGTIFVENNGCTKKKQ